MQNNNNYKPAKTIIPIESVVNNTINVMQELEKILKQETKALRAADFKTADLLQKNKKELSQGYHRNIQQLVNRKEEVSSLPVHIKESVIKKRTKFSEILAENMRVIDGVRQSSTRLINKIIESARDAVSDDAGYNASGNMYKTSSVNTSPVSISINEVL